MNASAGVTVPSNEPPGKEIPAAIRIPLWGQLPLEKQRELTQVLAEMLLKQVQALAVKHEQPS